MAAAAFAAAPQPPQAGTWNIDFNAASYHLESWARRDLNQRNPGLGVEYHASRRWGVMVGEYDNSYRRPTLYGLVAFTPLNLGRVHDWRLDAGVVAGLATGYRQDENRFEPAVAGALVRLRAPDGLGVNLVAVPNGGPRNSGFVGLQMVYRLP